MSSLHGQVYAVCACLSLLVTEITSCSMWLEKKFGRISRFAFMFRSDQEALCRLQPQPCALIQLLQDPPLKGNVVILPYRFLGSIFGGSKCLYKSSPHLTPSMMHLDLLTVLEGRYRERERRVGVKQASVQIPVCCHKASGEMEISLALILYHVEYDREL